MVPTNATAVADNRLMRSSEARRRRRVSTPKLRARSSPMRSKVMAGAALSENGNYQLRVMDAVRGRVQAHRLLAVAVLHDINLAASHADWLVVLREGSVVACGAPADVLQPGLLAEVYGVEARVEQCSQGRLQVLVDRALA